MNKEEFLKKVNDVIAEDIRPFIEADGGRIALEDVDETNKTVFVSLAGACAGCSGAAFTLKGGVERILREKVSPDIEVRLAL